MQDNYDHAAAAAARDPVTSAEELDIIRAVSAKHALFDGERIVAKLAPHMSCDGCIGHGRPDVCLTLPACSNTKGGWVWVREA